MLLKINRRIAFSFVLDKTPAVKGNRAWTEREYNDMQLARTMGLRVTEVIAKSRSQVEQALRSGVYQVKNEAKNGKWRQVPLSAQGRRVMESRIQNVPRGDRLFIRPGEKTHAAVNRVEKFMQNNRKQIETIEGQETRMYQGEANALTYHGLRYNYVQDRVQQEMEKGYSKSQAAAIVTKEAGHERIEVINIYLGREIAVN